MRDDVMQVIRDLAHDGMTMLVVTHEMQFATDIASRVWVIDQGAIAEDGPPAQVVKNPQSAVARDFFRPAAVINKGRAARTTKPLDGNRNSRPNANREAARWRL